MLLSALTLPEPAAGPPVEWRVSDSPIAYEAALAAMDQRVAEIVAGTAPELVWLIEHPPLYTAGTSAKPEDLVEARFPVHQTGRGGQFTYHGPGQRVGYVMMDLKQRGSDVRGFVRDLEEWLIRTLATFNVKGERREGRHVMQIRGRVKHVIVYSHFVSGCQRFRQVIVARRMGRTPRRMFQIHLSEPTHISAPIASALDLGRVGRQCRRIETDGTNERQQCSLE